MESLLLLIPISVAFTAIAFIFFAKAAGNGQFNNLESHGQDILNTDKPAADDYPNHGVKQS